MVVITSGKDVKKPKQNWMFSNPMYLSWRLPKMKLIMKVWRPLINFQNLKNSRRGARETLELAPYNGIVDIKSIIDVSVWGSVRDSFGEHTPIVTDLTGELCEDPPSI
ncbi:hypothetical protein V6N12_037976 [Hibiscus sabdariffa]|uniref:Uncharacterized protein n=1 Tax=Hibiscus sabdariffa TaxID=183260 RepID=A0ABR2BD98_9ROSI